VIRSGSRGDEVKSLQTFLIGLGFLPEGEADGIAGVKTITALKAYQASSGLVADGIAGPKTLGTARDDGWEYEDGPTQPQIETANELGIPVDVIQTIEAVESGGKPTALRFEAHVFLRKRPDLEEKIPFTPGPRGYSVTRSESDKGAFERAFALDSVAATESTSFGLYQVLGGHLIKLYGNPESGVDHFYASPTEVSYKLLVSWFKSNKKALKAAREKDWRKLARRYNGPGQVEHYSAALEREYKKVICCA
jgi:peptidoglycan hydrolase-like protein with peptidoglycan-binding domain